MSTTKLKLLCWSAAATLALGLCLHITWFVTNLERIGTTVTREELSQVLNSVPDIVVKADGFTDYDQIRRGFHDFNWTGKEKPVEQPVEDPADAPPPVQKIPLAQLLRVNYLQVDPLDPAGSSIVVRYKPAANVGGAAGAGGPGGGAADKVLHVGDRLAPPHDHARVHGITIEGAEFAFDDEEREHEVLVPDEFTVSGTVAQIVRAGGSWVAPERAARLIGSAAPPPSPETTVVYGNRIKMGTQDAAYIGENYAQILSQEVRHRRHRDAQGRYDGIEITEVAPGSTAARHGLQSGDVIKSINGHPVHSPSEAISYVKNNAGMHSGQWVVVIENLGQQRTLYVDPPAQP